MCHRIREAMTDTNPPPLGGKDKIIEADQTYYGNKISKKKVRKLPRVVSYSEDGKVTSKVNPAVYNNKYTVVSLVERGGNVRSFHIDKATSANVREILVRNADRQSNLMTDESKFYTRVGEEFNRHAHVSHKYHDVVTFIRTRWKVIIQSLSAVCLAHISIAARAIYNAM